MLVNYTENTQVFSCEICEIFKSTFFYETSLVAAFISHKYFSLKLAKILRPPFLEKICKRLLLERLKYMRQRSFFFYQNQWSYSGSMFLCFLGFSLQKILLLVLRQSSSNYKIGNSVTLFLVNPFPHGLWFFMFCRNQVSACWAEFSILGFCVRTSSVTVVSTRFFFCRGTNFCPCSFWCL